MAKSQASTPPAQDEATGAMSDPSIESSLDRLAVTDTSPPPAAESQPDVHFIDSLEMPCEFPAEVPPPPPPQAFEPVGSLAEMPTEQTALAYIEQHPNLVELDNNQAVAPAWTRETGAPGYGAAPREDEQTERDEPEVGRQAAEQQVEPEQEEHNSYPWLRQHLYKLPGEKQESFRIPRKPIGGAGQRLSYQPYSPCQENCAAPSFSTTDRRQSNGGSLLRQSSLVRSMLKAPTNWVPSSVPLSLRRPDVSGEPDSAAGSSFAGTRSYAGSVH